MKPSDIWNDINQVNSSPLKSNWTINPSRICELRVGYAIMCPKPVGRRTYSSLIKSAPLLLLPGSRMWRISDSRRSLHSFASGNSTPLCIWKQGKNSGRQTGFELIVREYYCTWTLTIQDRAIAMSYQVSAAGLIDTTWYVSGDSGEVGRGVDSAVKARARFVINEAQTLKRYLQKVERYANWICQSYVAHILAATKAFSQILLRSRIWRAGNLHSIQRVWRSCLKNHKIRLAS